MVSTKILRNAKATLTTAGALTDAQYKTVAQELGLPEPRGLGTVAGKTQYHQELDQYVTGELGARKKSFYIPASIGAALLVGSNFITGYTGSLKDAVDPEPAPVEITIPLEEDVKTNLDKRQAELHKYLHSERNKMLIDATKGIGDYTEEVVGEDHKAIRDGVKKIGETMKTDPSKK